MCFLHIDDTASSGASGRFLRFPGVRDAVTSIEFVGTLANTTCLDYTLANPDTLTKYKTAAGIAEKVLKEVSGASRPLPVAP